MLQSGGVGPGVRVLEALRHASALYDDSLEPAALLERVGLAGKERRTWRQISGGEQRRLALARVACVQIGRTSTPHSTHITPR